MPINTSIKKELIILVAGPLFQQLAYLFLLQILKNKDSIIKIYHYGILWFNLLPIYPLDGGKFLNLILSTKIPYKTSLITSIAISYGMTIGLFIINQKNLNGNIIIIIIFLLYKITKEKEKIELIYKKFLLERYLHQYQFKKIKIIKDQNKFYKNKKHLIKIGDNYYLEKDFLQKLYKKY